MERRGREESKGKRVTRGRRDEGGKTSRAHITVLFCVCCVSGRRKEKRCAFEGQGTVVGLGVSLLAPRRDVFSRKSFDMPGTL